MSSSQPSSSGYTRIKLSGKYFKLLSALIYENSGIYLVPEKKILLETRLNKLLKYSPYKDIKSYYTYVVNDKTGQAMLDIIDAISTNHTFFFRERAHFDYLETTAFPNIIGSIRKEGALDLRLWCAASATGEEPYGLAMTLMEFLGSEYASWKAGILASDISPTALSKAKKGIFKEKEVNSLPPDLKHKYFKKLATQQWEAESFLKQEVLFRRFNLMNTYFPFRKPFHIIFCRNVMIYFDQKTISELVHRLYHYTMPGGYLFIGHSESLHGIKNPYENNVYPSVYQKKW